MELSFSGKVALVTGAGSGMGLATTQAFAKAGAAVVLADINGDAVQNEAELLKNKGIQALGICCDVTDENQVKAMIDLTVETFGHLDAAYNNAGVQSLSTDTAELTAVEWDRVVNINLRATWLCMKYELLQMRRQGNGTIVNCSSLGGLVGLPGRAAYHAAKHGVLGLTKSAAIEYAPRNIRINAVCPGTIETPMVEDMIVSGDLSLQQAMQAQPIGRLGKPQEIADVVLWLSSQAASFVIGQAISVDGGYTIM